jgi:hypothetical protein
VAVFLLAGVAQRGVLVLSLALALLAFIDKPSRQVLVSDAPRPCSALANLGLTEVPAGSPCGKPLILRLLLSVLRLKYSTP